MTRQTRALRRACHWLLVGGWILLVPPGNPHATSLPPVSQWSKVSAHKTADECERSKDAVRNSARAAINKGTVAKPSDVNVALARLQAKCVEGPKDPAPPTPAAKTTEPAKEAAKPDAGKDAAPAPKRSIH